MTLNEVRSVIRDHAEGLNCRYRITDNGEVHYYGRMPNSIETGWYFVGHDAAKVAAEIEAGER